MAEVTFDVYRPYRSRKPATPVGEVRGVHVAGESAVITTTRKYDSLTTSLPDKMAMYALRFFDNNYVYKPDKAFREDVPFNCVTFAGTAVFRGISEAVRRQICWSHKNRLVRPGEFIEPDRAERRHLLAGAMYGIIDQQNHLCHAFIGLTVPDRHLTVMGNAGDYMIDSTSKVLQRFYEQDRLVRFIVRPDLLGPPEPAV